MLKAWLPTYYWLCLRSNATIYKTLLSDTHSRYAHRLLPQCAAEITCTVPRALFIFRKNAISNIDVYFLSRPLCSAAKATSAKVEAVSSTSTATRATSDSLY